MAPYTTPWSVRPTAGMPSSLARANIFGIRLAPSSIEYSEWECRCTKLNPGLRRKREKSLHGCNSPESSPHGDGDQALTSDPLQDAHSTSALEWRLVKTEPRPRANRKPGGAHRARKPAGSELGGAAAGAAPEAVPGAGAEAEPGAGAEAVPGAGAE